ncbi:MAG: 6-carboxytetrahydropterin synthase QueD [Desulfocucumaceae bacterium]
MIRPAIRQWNNRPADTLGSGAGAGTAGSGETSLPDVNTNAYIREAVILFELTIKRRFSAAHKLVGHSGQCAALHGHTWAVEVGVSGEQLDACGMLIDFKVLKELVDGIIVELDHKYLNEIEYFSEGSGVNPTAENIACYVYGKVKAGLGKISPQLAVLGVRIWESPDASALYREVL